MVINIIQLFLLIAAVGTIIFNQYNENKRHKLQFFTEYTRRYQDIILRMPEDPSDPQFLKYMQLYFGLCSEEFYLYKKGLIDKNVWDLWVDGMALTMKKRSFKTAWQGHLAQHYNDDDFLHFISELIR